MVEIFESFHNRMKSFVYELAVRLRTVRDVFLFKSARIRLYFEQRKILKRFSRVEKKKTNTNLRKNQYSPQIH